MVTPDLLQYIRARQAQGTDDTQIHQALMLAGWKQRDINEAFDQLLQKSSIAAPKPTVTDSRAASQTIPVTQTFGAVQLLGLAGLHYRRHFFSLVSLAVILAVITRSTGYLLQNVIFPSGESVSVPPLGWIIFALAILVLIFVSVHMWLTLAIIHIVADRSGSMSLLNALKKAWQKLFSVGWLLTISVFILIAGFALFVVPGVLWSLVVVFALFVSLDEDKRGFAALLGGKQYLKGHWLSVVFRALVATFFVTLLIMGIELVIRLTSIAIPEYWYLHLQNVTDIFLYVLFYPFVLVHAYLVFKTTKGSSLLSNSPFLRRDVWMLRIFVVLGLLVAVGVVIGAYFASQQISLLSPTTSVGDLQRQNDLRRLQLVLDKYYLQNGGYPQTFSSLKQMPDYSLNSSEDYFSYSQLNEGGDYHLCVEKMSGEEECVKSGRSSTTITPVPTVEPTPTPTPQIILETVRQAILLYQENKGNLPTQLSELAPTYFNDPSLDLEKSFQYVPDSEAQEYLLCYITEQGASFCVDSRQI